MKEKNVIDVYIDEFDGELKNRMEKIRAIINEILPEATEKIGYNMPTFYWHENVVHFAIAKDHIGFYPSPSGVECFKILSDEYKTSKGTVQFPNNKPIPYDLIEKTVLFRKQEIEKKYKDKKLYES